MTAGVKGNISTAFNVTLIGSPDVGSATFELQASDKFQITQGTGVAQADILYAEIRTIAASGNESLDLTTGLVTPLGEDVVFAKVKVIDITAAAANTNDVIIGGAASNAFDGPMGGTSPTLTLPPGGRVRLIHPGAGWTVDSTHKALKVANGGAGTGVDYTIILIGNA